MLGWGDGKKLQRKIKCNNTKQNKYTIPDQEKKTSYAVLLYSILDIFCRKPSRDIFRQVVLVVHMGTSISVQKERRQQYTSADPTTCIHCTKISPIAPSIAHCPLLTTIRLLHLVASTSRGSQTGRLPTQAKHAETYRDTRLSLCDSLSVILSL